MKNRRRLFPRAAASSLVLMVAYLPGCAVHGIDRLTAEQKAEAERIEAYLNRATPLTGSFSQEGSWLGSGAGRFVYQPGQLNLAYNSPHAMNLRATRARLKLHDLAKGAVTTIDISHQALGLLLRKPVRLRGRVLVTDLRDGPDTVQISLAEARNPSQGLLTLTFLNTSQGLQLSRLAGIDVHHHRFTVSFHEVTLLSSTKVVSPKN